MSIVYHQGDDILFIETSKEPMEQDESLKHRLAGLTEGLSEDDLRRARDFGRSDPQWDS